MTFCFVTGKQENSLASLIHKSVTLFYSVLFADNLFICSFQLIDLENLFACYDMKLSL